MEFIRMERHGGVAVMVWNHEEQNRFTGPFLTEVLTALEEAERDESVCALVVTAAQEKYFSTGLHLEWMMAQGAENPENVGSFLRLLSRLLITCTGFGKPLVAALNGHTVGGGLIVPACMDYRFMREDKGFLRLPEVQINIPFWPGMTSIFQEILPPRTIRDMFYTGERFTPQQALEMGLVDRLFPPDELLPRSIEWAAKLGTAQPATYRTIKRGLRHRTLHLMETEDAKAIDEMVANLKQARG